MNDLLAMRTAEGKLLAFHARNLEVANISVEAWETLRGGSEGLPDAFQALRDWEQTTNPEGLPSESRSTLLINVTQVCNLHCKYCAAGGDGTYGDPIKRIAVEKTIPQVFSFIDRVPADQSFQINFFGGEPLLYPDGIRILAEAAAAYAEEKKVKIFFHVITNGTLIDEARLQLLVDLKASVSVSLDGPAEMNDQRRPGKGGKPSTHLVLEGLKKLSAVKDQLGGLSVSGVFAKGIDLTEVYRFYRTLGVDSYGLNYDVYDRDPEASAAFVKEMERVAFLAYNLGGETELRKINYFSTIFDILDSQTKVRNHCEAGKTSFTADSNNNVYACPWQVGDTKELVGQGSMLFQNRLAEYQNPLTDKTSCQDCWARYLCGGGCMVSHQAATGNRHKVDELFCERTRQVAAIALMYYEKCRSGDRHEEA